jgi:hypothetical protein
LFQQSLGLMLRDATAVPDADRVYALVSAEDAVAIKAIEESGFEHKCSLFQNVFFGRTRHSFMSRPSAV